MNSLRVSFIIGLAGLALALGWQAKPLYAASCATIQTDSASPAPGQDRPADSADESHLVTLPAGSVISVRIADRVDSSHGHSGDLLTGIVDPSVLLGDHVVIPRTTEPTSASSKIRKADIFTAKQRCALSSSA